MFSALRLSAALSVVLLASARSEIAVQSGEKIAFLGDSITLAGWMKPDGFARLVDSGLAANGVKTETVVAADSGLNSNQLLGRLQRDVLDKHPHWLILSCGVNDVAGGKSGVPLDEAMAASGSYHKPDRGTFKANIASIVDRARTGGVKPVILTTTVIQEQLDNPWNVKLVQYNEFLREFARERQLPLADLNTMFRERLKAENKPDQNILTSDGVHMIAPGDKLMAKGILKALGLDEAQLKTAEGAWSKQPS